MKLGRRALSALGEVNAPTIIYDVDLKGFGLRLTPPSGRHPGGSRTWIVEYRPGSGGRSVAKKRVSLGSVESLTPEQARDAARTMLATVRLGGDPQASRAEARSAKQVSELQALYIEEVDPVRKHRTVELYRGYWRTHILPVLGATPARDVSKQEVMRLHRSIGRHHKVTANRVLTLLSHFFSWARTAGHVPNDHNPCSQIDKFGEAGRERFLSEEELSRLGAALEQAEMVGVPWRKPEGAQLSKHRPKAKEKCLTRISSDAADAIRLLLFTGARLREILHLQWTFYDRQRQLLLLPDSKTGRKTIVLGRHAVETLERIRGRAVKGPAEEELRNPASPFVFPSRDLRSPRVDLKRPWALVTREAGLLDLRLHDLRHSYASVGVAADLGLPVIGRLLGHAAPHTTSRYAHLAAAPLRSASDRISDALYEALASRADGSLPRKS